MALAKSISRVRFCALAGVEPAHIKRDSVEGQWKPRLGRITSPTGRRLVEDFLNWGTDASRIAAFTKKYGPPSEYPMPGRRFKFHLSHWQKLQKKLRLGWRSRALVTGWELHPKHLRSVSCDEGRMLITASNLYSYLWLDFISSPLERCKFCGNPECANPFFIAHHLGQNYCSDTCALWGKRQ
jgi:hypothetical protein